MSMTRREFCGLAAATIANVIVLPYVVKPLARGLPDLPAFGAMVEEGFYAPVEQIPWIAPGTLTRYRIRWDEVEIVPGAYDWSKPDKFMLAGVGPVMVNVICTPQAYRIDPAVRCSPPTPTYLNRLAWFCRMVVERYHPAAIELWNEPEISAADAAGIGAAHVLGGFGDNAEYYGQAVSAVWQQFQEAWAPTWLVAGSIMDSSVDWWLRARSACAGQYDAISYHSYVTYPGQDYQRTGNGCALLRACGETVPVILGETALLAEIDSPLFREAQATFLRYQIDQRVAHGLHAIVWYALETNLWRNSDMLLYHQPQPVYEVYRGMR